LSTEVRVVLEGRGPEMPGVPDRHAPCGVGCGNCADSNAGARLCACRTDATLEIGRRGAEPRANASEREIHTGLFGGFVAEFAIRGISSPILVAARQQIEQDCAGHDRDTGFTHLKTATLRAKPGLHP